MTTKTVTAQFSGYTTADVTATSDAINIENAKRVTIRFAEEGTVLNRSGVLTIDGQLENDGSYYTINTLIDNVANTNAQTLTRVSSKTRAAAGSDILALSQEFGFKNIKAKVTVTDGATPAGFFQVFVYVEY